jgi:hypothetical protein
MDFMLPKITEFICYLKSRNSYVTQNHGIPMLHKVTEFIYYLKSRNSYVTDSHGIHMLPSHGIHMISNFMDLICYLKAQNSCYLKSRNSCYLKSRILTDMHRVLYLFLRRLSNDASVSQNMQRRTIQWLMNNEMRKDLKGVDHGIMEVLSRNLSVGSMKYLSHDVKCPDCDSRGSTSGLFPVTVRRLA